MGKRAWLAAFAATGVMLTSACADLLGFHDLRLGDAGGADVAQPDGGDDGAVCTHAAVPTVPSSTDPGDAGDFTLALHHVYFTSTADGGAGHYGYDIDDHCTADKASSSCVVPTGNTVVVDEPNGVDNETIALLNALITAQSSLQDALGDTALNKAIGNGDFTVLLRLYGYKGGANQGPPNSMFFGVQASPALTGGGTPAFDGGDRWFPATQDVATSSDGGPGTNFPLQTTTNVYVTNHVLVVTYASTVTLRFVVAPNSTISGVLVIKLAHPVLTATITPHGDGRYDLTNGTIVGRWNIVDGLATVGSLTLPGNTALCDFTGGFNQIRDAICGGRDVNGAGNDDGAHACDAVSVAVGFDAVASDVANSPMLFPESTTPCADAGGCTN